MYGSWSIKINISLWSLPHLIKFLWISHTNLVAAINLFLTILYSFGTQHSQFQMKVLYSSCRLKVSSIHLKPALWFHSLAICWRPSTAQLKGLQLSSGGPAQALRRASAGPAAELRRACTGPAQALHRPCNGKKPAVLGGLTGVIMLMHFNIWK